jgi:importin subunit beta-1
MLAPFPLTFTMLTPHSDLGETFPNGQLANYLRSPRITELIRETRAAREYSDRTRETAKWARSVAKAQTQGNQGDIMK